VENLKGPEKPPSIKRFEEIVGDFRNFYWNNRPEKDLIPDWKIGG